MAKLIGLYLLTMVFMAFLFIAQASSGFIVQTLPLW